MDILQNEDQLTNLELEVDSDTKQSLAIAAYWAKFISIFIFSTALLVILLLALVSNQFMQGFQRAFGSRFDIFENGSSGLFLVFMFIVLALLGVVYYFLYNFGNKTKTALLSENIEEFNKGLNSLKIYFIIMGILGMLSIVSEVFTLTGLF